MPRPKPQNPVIDRGTLVEVSRFLARAWSEKYGIELVVSENVKVPSTNLREDGRMVVEMPPLSAIAINDVFMQYRVWRKVLWHEAMHAYFGLPKELDSDAWRYRPVWAMIANAIEDYKIEEAGVRIYPGMETEKKLADMVFVNRMDSEIDDIVGFMEDHYDKKSIEQYLVITSFIYAVTAGVIPPKMYSHLPREKIDLVKRVAEYARANAFSKPLHGLAEEVVKMLGIDERSADRVINDYRFSNANLDYAMKNPYVLDPERTDSKSELVEQIKKLGAEDSLDAPEEVKQEFEKIVSESIRRQIEMKQSKISEEVVKEAEVLGVNNEILIPDSSLVDETPLYDHALISHLKDKLRAIKRRFSEVYSHTGDEIDVEEYVRKGKPFVSEVYNSKPGGIRVMILLDFSGSIDSVFGLCKKYKKAAIALAEALNYVGADFSIYAFSQNKQIRVSVYRIKAREEKWSRVNARRLAAIIADGYTPLHRVYQLLSPLVKAHNPHFFITLTDGLPDKIDETKKEIAKLSKVTKMIAIAIGDEYANIEELAMNLRKLGYHKSVAVENLMSLPERILRLLLD